MKKAMNRESTSLIQPIQLLNVRVFLIPTQGGWALVDTGLPFFQDRLVHAIQARGVDLSGIQAIILTHGHLDHIGCLAALQDLSGAAVICHSSLAPLLHQGLYEEAVPRVPLWKIFNQLVHQALGGSLQPVQADVVCEESLDLEKYGLAGQLLHTPGHSPGSLSIILETGECFIGDLLREPAPGRYDTGLFYDDLQEIFTSLRKIAAWHPSLVYLSHGSTMSGGELERFIRENHPD